MKKISILEHINLGNAIAEYDTNIGHYYIDTAYVYDLVNDRYDIIKGVNIVAQLSRQKSKIFIMN